MQNALTERQERFFLLTLAGIQFSHILDFMIMMPLGPMLMADWQIGAHEFGLLVAAYSFSAAISGILASTFVDRFERRNLLRFLLLGFAVSTLGCALASSYSALMLARGLAGAFGGVLGAMVQTMVGDVIPFARRASASGVVASAFSLSTVAGVPLSLWLANHLQWRAPFVLIAVLGLICVVIAKRTLPTLSAHLSEAAKPHWFADLFAVLRDANHLRALAYSALIIFSGFTVIPYITVYAVNNIGVSLQEIPWIYFVGGVATLLTARKIGRWADRAGKVKVYRIVALLASLPLGLITHLQGVGFAVWLVCTTLFFVLVSGRMIPAMAIVTSAAQAPLRGTFMSMHATVQSLAMGLATTLSGFLITQLPSGAIQNYALVGDVAICANLLAILFVGQVVLRDQR